ncbi:hypothetical protein [Streptomyces sp. NPDC057854]|uniref:hypothetical protein n=1 Tax=unclassified Streptomyces TaxID=2593676 RepID=UPI003685B9C6
MATEPVHLDVAGRAAFEGVMREALAVPDIRQALARLSAPVTADQIRNLALAATDAIAAVASTEYATLRRLRAADARASAMPGGNPPHPVTAGRGLLTALAVITPVLSAAAAIIFLILGYLLQLVEVQRTLVASLIQTGWAALVPAAFVAGAVAAGLVVSAVRRRAACGEVDGLTSAQAHAAWRNALLERGLLPFLRRQLQPQNPSPSTRRTGRGGGRPDFTAAADPSKGWPVGRKWPASARIRSSGMPQKPNAYLRQLLQCCRFVWVATDRHWPGRPDPCSRRNRWESR